MGTIPDPMPVHPGDMLSVIKDFPNQIREAITLGTEIVIRDPIDNIIISGIGGSGTAGDVLQSILWEDKAAVHQCKGMTLPGYANTKTLVVCISYTGDTDEVLSVYTDATKKKCKILAITCGGKLSSMAKQDAIPTVLLPRGMLPRASYGYILFSLLAILSRSHLCGNNLQNLDALLNLLERAPYVVSAKALASRLSTAIPIMFSTPRLHGVAMHWQANLNLNAKAQAFCSTIPDAAHTSLACFGASKHPYHAILLHDDRDPLPLKKRIDAFKHVIRSSGTQVTDIELKGLSHVSKIVSACHLGDFVSYFLSETLGTDPASTTLLDEFKALVKKGEGQK